MYIPYESIIILLINRKQAISKLRSVAIFKKIALQIEELKFNDLCRKIVEGVIRSSRANSLKASQAMRRDFNKVVSKEVERMSERDHQIRKIKDDENMIKMVSSFIEAKIPKKNVNGLSQVLSGALTPRPGSHAEHLQTFTSFVDVPSERPTPIPAPRKKVKGPFTLPNTLGSKEGSQLVTPKTNQSVRFPAILEEGGTTSNSNSSIVNHSIDVKSFKRPKMAANANSSTSSNGIANNFQLKLPPRGSKNRTTASGSSQDSKKGGIVEKQKQLVGIGPICKPPKPGNLLVEAFQLRQKKYNIFKEKKNQIEKKITKISKFVNVNLEKFGSRVDMDAVFQRKKTSPNGASLDATGYKLTKTTENSETEDPSVSIYNDVFEMVLFDYLTKMNVRTLKKMDQAETDFKKIRSYQDLDDFEDKQSDDEQELTERSKTSKMSKMDQKEVCWGLL